MYIQANQYEREVSIHKITDPKEAILGLVRELYNQILDLESYQDEDDIDESNIDLDILFNNEDSHHEDCYENLQKLKYFLQHPLATFARLEKDSYLRIWTQYDPMYSIEIRFENGHYSFEAYSNINNDYMWDQVMQYVE